MNENGDIVSLTQKVEYENVPEYCQHSKVQGHSEEKCRVLHPELRNVQKKSEALQNHSTHPRNDKNNNKKENKYPSNSTTQVDKQQGEQNSGRERKEQKHTDEGWTTVTRGKGKGKNTTSTNIQQLEALGENTMSKNHQNEILSKIADVSIKETSVFGYSFMAQRENKGEAMKRCKGKRKEIVINRPSQENNSQSNRRKGRVQKNNVEATNPPYERRNRRRRGSIEEATRSPKLGVGNNNTSFNSTQENTKNIMIEMDTADAMEK